ncbi:hypothetical protein FKW77_005352 [Venturia effusa]|uniref:Copper transport protein n=1 Tax=Venturia effusa TaxID=50376 RepID=A0A517L3B0_9PEZI|nr:hypothetical protein FKW77_005352 [Venturia effusa]
MDASDMVMAFFSSQHTPLYSASWTPKSSGAYAGTCIFLVVLTIIFRSLLAAKHILEQRWGDKAWDRRYVVVAEKQPVAEQSRTDPDLKTAILTANGVEEQVKVVQRPARSVQPWRFSVDLPRALLVTVMTGVGYLLMLAIMTFNIGYFMSILLGTLVGELAFGRFSQTFDDHN